MDLLRIASRIASGSFELKTCELADGEDPTSGMPGFAVQGLVDGEPFKAIVSLEFAGRDADYETLVGPDLYDDVDLAAEVIEAIWSTNAFKSAYALWESSGEL